MNPIFPLGDHETGPEDIILGALVLKEPLTMGMAIGFPLVIIGSILGTTRAAQSSPDINP